GRLFLQEIAHGTDLRSETAEQMTDAALVGNDDQLVALIGLDAVLLLHPGAGRHDAEMMTITGKFGCKGDQPGCGMFVGPDGIRRKPEDIHGYVHLVAMMVMTMG